MTFSTDDVGPTKRDEIVDPAIIAHCVGKVELRGDAIFVTSLQLVNSPLTDSGGGHYGN
jgi:hypothetical protein